MQLFQMIENINEKSVHIYKFVDEENQKPCFVINKFIHRSLLEDDE
jgi:hypothetical protein